MDPTTPAIETSSESIETPTQDLSGNSGSEMDWASRLDAAFDSIEPKSDSVEEEKPVVKKPNSKAKTSKEKPSKVSEKPSLDVDKSEDTKDVSDEAVKDEEPKDEDSNSDSKEEAPKGLTEKAAVKWGELRNENRAYKKEIETLKAELEKTKNTVPSNDSELEQLRSINAEYERELSAARVEATQEYKANVVEPMVGVMGFLGEIASKYDLAQKDFLEAFAESDPSKQSDLITDLASSMNERDRLRLYGAADDYSEIIRRRDFYQASSKERLSQIEAERKAEIAKQREQAEKSTVEARDQYEKATSKVFEDLKKSVSVLSDEEVASDVQRLAKADYSNANPELKSYLAHSGALLPHLLKALQSAKADLEKANKTIVGYRNGSPKAGSGSSENSRAIPEEIGFLEALEKQLG